MRDRPSEVLSFSEKLRAMVRGFSSLISPATISRMPSYPSGLTKTRSNKPMASSSSDSSGALTAYRLPALVRITATGPLISKVSR